MDNAKLYADLRTMSEAFDALASSHLKITKPLSFGEFEGGLYGYYYAKPSKRFRHILSIDREVLVVVTSFTDQQQRTLRFASQLMDDSEGRLERSVFVVAHRDPDGNRKLVKWGRDSGLTVMPYFLQRVGRSDAGFERVFFADLFAQDPFDVRGPVSDDANFYGRRDEAQELARKLINGHIRSLLAVRKVGKTSVINRTVDLIKLDQSSLVVMIDCSVDGIWKSDARRLLDAMANALDDAVSTGNSYTTIVATSEETMEVEQSVSRLQGALRRAARPVILVLDEVDYITPGTTAPAQQWGSEFNRFWRNLRAVFQEAPRQGARLSLLVAGVSSKWFSVESINGEENAALAFIPEEYLRPLARGATLAMVRRLGSRAGLTFSEPCLEAIAEATGDVPYWTRMACSFIHRQSPIEFRPVSLDEQVTEQLLEQFIEQEGAVIAEVALRHLFRVFPELKDACIRASKGETLNPYLSGVLSKYGIVEPSTGKLRSRIVPAGLALHAEKEQIALSPNHWGDIPRNATDDLDQWAEELAVISRNRNILERRLRAIVLNFIKLDALQDKSKPRAKDRVLAPKSTEERRKFASASAEQVIEKLTWLELHELVKKEWRICGAIFNDLDQLSKHTDVINDRFDAHAKKVDAADIALYRRSLAWFEQQLAKLE